MERELARNHLLPSTTTAALITISISSMKYTLQHRTCPTHAHARQYRKEKSVCELASAEVFKVNTNAGENRKRKKQ
jgi:hypothetical protein